MSEFKVEKDFMMGDYRCVILGLSIGHRCGYVGLPKEHKYNDKDYDEIDVNVHGGLTFAGKGRKYPVDDDRYYIGFDCAYYNDKKDLKLMKELCDEKTYNILADIEDRFDTGGIVRTTEYVEEQLKELVNQLSEGENVNEQ